MNLDAWALYRNFEIAIMARDAATANLFEERIFTPDIAHSIVGTKPGGALNGLKNWMWHQLAYFL